MSTKTPTGQETAGTTTEPTTDHDAFEGSCGCDGDRFPCFECYRNGRRGLPRYRRVA